MDVVIHTEQMSLKCKEIHSLTWFRRTEKKKVGEVGMLWWKETLYEDVDHYDLKLVYLDMNGKRAEYGATFKGDSVAIKKQFQDMQRQIKAQDASFIDRAFEEQVLK